MRRFERIAVAAKITRSPRILRTLDVRLARHPIARSAKLDRAKIHFPRQLRTANRASAAPEITSSRCAARVDLARDLGHIGARVTRRNRISALSSLAPRVIEQRTQTQT
jgi:hypothetical protein